MYTFSSKLKTFSFALMIIGLLGVGYGFFSGPSTVEEVKVMLQDSHDAHGEVADSHGTDAYAANADAHGDEHAEHVLHLIKNKPWSALYVALFFFFMISLATLAFYAIQHAAQAGWSVVLFRVMEGITAYLPVGGVLLFVFFVLSSLHMNHLFTWMDPEVVAHDELIQNKSGYLNVPFFLIRAAIYIIGWVIYRNHARKLTLAQDNASDLSNYTKLFKRSAAFLVFFLVSESMMSWDWIMSLDPHWFSTLFGWYVFASMIVSAITTIALISIYLKGKGYLEFVNDSHLHDLAKFMFGFSVFWTYLWFSQFMLIWYADIPEEVTYFISRFNEYKIPFLGMLVLNFLFPLLVLMNSDYKRVPWFIVTTGIVILIGHYVDIFVMIMPATVGDQWFFGISEISSVLLVLGIFIYVVFTALSKAPLLAKGNPFIKESEHFHY
ncbi:quinol:cytochrome c oxidoreductase quinone-binding subunit 2 [Lutibacter oricola]|uniref:Quinol:cytochrome c oxidoreductase quinone-binding subunit 2 n=1 Tax=Lutibacter oricola TaxID=762486 RepID=A0A1H3EIV8_9FLAO|nr:quinol:cytochrome C oxidoreductase [Lutibacter oricola]SDX78525.1 quinol:cytochrome c oxidoreductase quinone-binding subunit 2 [Lutibacter oricola]